MARNNLRAEFVAPVLMVPFFNANFDRVENYNDGLCSDDESVSEV